MSETREIIASGTDEVGVETTTRVRVDRVFTDRIAVEIHDGRVILSKFDPSRARISLLNAVIPLDAVAARHIGKLLIERADELAAAPAAEVA